MPSPWSSSGARRNAALVAVFVCALGAAHGSRAADFPPVTEAERALRSVPGAPGAPAVVLFKNGELAMLDPSRHENSSQLSVQGRIKILTEEGKSQGEVEIEHSDFVRLSNVQGRTVLPDGTIVPLPVDARFVRRTSKNRDLYVTVVAFPAVSVGAILDYSFDLHFDSIFFVEPWYFASRLPTLRSEIVYSIPKSMAVKTWNRDLFGVGIKSERVETGRTVKLKTWAENLPPVPREPFGLAFEDMAAQVMMLPTALTYDDGETVPLFDNWGDACRWPLELYRLALGGDREAARRARDLARVAGKGQREPAAAIYRFVRDQLANEAGDGIFVADKTAVDDVLKRGRGDSAEKALLLVAMLDAVKVKARPVWAAERGHGLVDLQVVNPDWFRRVLVAAEIDGHRVFLDPSQRALGFGQLPAELEGTPALIPDRTKPESLVLPETPAERSGRRAVLRLTVDDKGALQGSGTLVLAGHEATPRIGWQADAAATAAAWKEWLEKQHQGFVISDVQVTESAEERKVEVRWAMAERAEEALGDEVTLLPSRPLGPARQPFPSVSTRSTAIVFDFAPKDEVELELAWTAGWSLSRQPKPVREASAVGTMVTEVEVKPAERSLTYRRRLDVAKKRFSNFADCSQLYALYEAEVKSDAESLVLARR